MNEPKEWNETLLYGLDCVVGFNTALQKFKNRQNCNSKIREVLSKQCPQEQLSRQWEKLPVESLDEYYQGIIYAVSNAKEIIKQSQQGIVEEKLNPFYEPRKDLHELLRQSCMVDRLQEQLQILEKSVQLVRLDSSEEELFLAEAIWETRPCADTPIKTRLQSIK
eukprot:TRINITY_DN2036_c0_g3_i1.p1 TRINITY_DN2036_c0_g3~~TRINITY_DN2036_c0_g3_i1.p1  ORF type:complete len:165 (-),score=11.05 TRINITY_DN2036_c0_g3_i1:234-728(-)